MRDLYIKSVALRKQIRAKDGDMQKNVTELHKVETSIALFRWVLNLGEES